MLEAFITTFIAGLAIIVGGSLIFFVKKFNKDLLGYILGFSAGVIIYIALVPMMSEARESLMLMNSEKVAIAINIAFSFIGIVIMILFEKLMHKFGDFHHDDEEKNIKTNKLLYRTGIVTAIALIIHNIPEGIIAFTSVAEKLDFKELIIAALFLHNMPKGLALATPLFYGTKNKLKTIIIVSIVAMAQPIGGLLGYLVLKPFLNGSFIGILLSIVSGVMIYIAFDEILPSAIKNGNHHKVTYGIISGMLVVAMSFILL